MKVEIAEGDVFYVRSGTTIVQKRENWYCTIGQTGWYENSVVEDGTYPEISAQKIVQVLELLGHAVEMVPPESACRVVPFHAWGVYEPLFERTTVHVSYPAAKAYAARCDGAQVVRISKHERGDLARGFEIAGRKE